MFIIERRTAGVLAALAIAAAMVLLGYIGDPVDGVETPTAAISTTALVRSVGPDAKPIAFATNEPRTAGATSEIERR